MPGRKRTLAYSHRLVVARCGVLVATLGLCPIPARAEISVTMELVPGQVVASGETFVLEVFITSTEPMHLTAVQVDLPCEIDPAAGGSGLLASQSPFVRVLDQSDPSSGSVPWLFAFQDEDHQGGLRPVAVADCRAAGAINAGEGAYLLPANTKRYLATAYYAVSECAFGTFPIRFEGMSDPPHPEDTTIVISATYAPLGFAAPGLSVAPLPCSCDVNEECANGVFCDGFESCFDGACQPGTDPCPGRRCLEDQSRCVDCFDDSDCDDGNPCTTDQCEPETFTCIRAGATGVACSDGLFCNGTDWCVSGQCEPGTQPACSPIGLRPHCDEALDRCVECLSDEHCGQPQRPLCRLANGQCVQCLVDADCDDTNPCTADVCTEGFICDHRDRDGEACDDGLACTIDDTCASGECVPGGTNCHAGERCDPKTGQCVPDPCLGGPMTALVPSDLTVDARQPWPPDAPTMLSGIGDPRNPIRVSIAASGVPPACFQLCESPESLEWGPNAVVDVIEESPGVFTLLPVRPLSPLAVTTIRYLGGGAVRLVAHPANVDASEVVDVGDIEILIRHIVGRTEAPFGLFSADVDHSGEANLVDLVRCIDLLQASASYPPYGGASMPENECPP